MSLDFIAHGDDATVGAEDENEIPVVHVGVNASHEFHIAYKAQATSCKRPQRSVTYVST